MKFFCVSFLSTEVYIFSVLQEIMKIKETRENIDTYDPFFQEMLCYSESGNA